MFTFYVLKRFVEINLNQKIMKNLKNVLLFVCLLAFVSCSDATDEDLGISGEGTFTAKVDGVVFTSLKATVGASVTNQVVAVQGSKSNGEYIRFNILNYAGIGTYTTGDAVSNTNSIQYGTVTPISTWISTFNLGTGTIEITEDTSTNISGTFSFTGVQDGFANKIVTEGTFNAPKI